MTDWLIGGRLAYYCVSLHATNEVITRETTTAVMGWRKTTVYDQGIDPR